MNQKSYDSLFEKLLLATKTVATNSMSQAASNVIENQEGNCNTVVSVDGSWQRRGHSSHNGIVTAISVITGKALDIEILTNYCKGCAQWSKEQESTSQYKKWKETHNCHLNHTGSAGSMEPEGAIRIFQDQ